MLLNAGSLLVAFTVFQAYALAKSPEGAEEKLNWWKPLVTSVSRLN
jgi:hypothetical protein